MPINTLVQGPNGTIFIWNYYFDKWNDEFRMNFAPTYSCSEKNWLEGIHEF